MNAPRPSENPDGTPRVQQHIVQTGRWSWYCHTTHGVGKVEGGPSAFGWRAKQRILARARRQAEDLHRDDVRRLGTEIELDHVRGHRPIADLRQAGDA